ncbi:hypothetical protein GJ744_002469 [Endocarpon pusillum]|uniref:Uncharacterized protein n=1 Tax=Endocarpon pusillum TaxID=364733 RepID=A0A8H7ABA0_9EURO|nr:hypothetical protein GJ744_002469 [Endocarpon pusillum]
MEHFVFLVRQHIAPDPFSNLDDLFRAVRQFARLRYSAAAFRADVITWKLYVLSGNLRHIQQAQPSLLVVPSHDFGLQCVREARTAFSGR